MIRGSVRETGWKLWAQIGLVFFLWVLLFGLGVPETVDRLVTILQSKGMTVFARIDHAAEAEKVGLKMRPSQLLVFGNPKGGTPLMVAAPTVAVDLPFKALAWEDAGGKVWLSYNSPSYLKERHGIDGKDEALKSLAGALDAMTDKALE